MSEHIYEDSDMEHERYHVIPFGWRREEIVRCRDCKEFTFGSDEYATVDWCDYWTAYVESPDGFCAWGERRDDGQTE